MSKMRMLEQGSYSSIGFITPSPDYSIAHEGSQGVMIECPAWRTNESVLKWIAAERGGRWKMVEWIIAIDGVEKTMPNPHKNSHQLWSYLVRQVK